MDKVYESGGFTAEEDTPYFQMETLPNPETSIWQIVSHALCHPVDFASISMLRRTIPDIDKQSKLEVTLEDIEQIISLIGIRPLNELVVVHPGRHWPSKTFPSTWWDEVIEGLVGNDLPVVIVGKDLSEEQGYVNISDHEWVINVRDL